MEFDVWGRIFCCTPLLSCVKLRRRGDVFRRNFGVRTSQEALVTIRDWLNHPAARCDSGHLVCRCRAFLVADGNVFQYCKNIVSPSILVLSNVPGQAKITLLAWSTARLVFHSWHRAKRASWAPKRRRGGTIRAIVSPRAHLLFTIGVFEGVNKTRNISVDMDATPINDRATLHEIMSPSTRESFLTRNMVPARWAKNEDSADPPNRMLMLSESIF